MPIIPPAIDTSITRDVAAIATSITAIAPRRSDQGARLKKTHQTKIVTAAARPPIIATISLPGTTPGRTNRRHMIAAATMPGHSRSA